MVGDPFEVPPSIIPAGMVYQWCSRMVMGEPDPRYLDMLEGGWLPVPKERHPAVFPNCDGDVEVGGQVLMSRLVEVSQEAQQINEDKAYRNARAASRIVHFGDINIRASAHDLEQAAALGISAQQIALRRLKDMADGRMPGMMLVGDMVRRNQLVFRNIVRPRRPRHPALRWLFNFISTED